MVKVRYCELLLFFVFLLSGGQDVSGSECRTSGIGSWRCSKCGEGTRCVYCSKCLGFCHKPVKRRAVENNFSRKIEHQEHSYFVSNDNTLKKQKPYKIDLNITYGKVAVPYKFPVLEMFKDIEGGIFAEEISHQDVVELYQAISLALREDCEICNDSKELRKLREYTISVHKKLKKLFGSIKFKDTALKMTMKAHNMTEKIPEKVISMVDPNSEIILDVPDYKLGLMLTGSGGGPKNSSLKLKSVEIINLNGTHRCSLPDFPNTTWGHTQNSLTICGNENRMYRSNCFKLTDGAWTLTHTLLKPRAYHSSWQTASGVLLMGGVGYRSEKNTEMLSQENALIDSQLSFPLLNSSRFIFNPETNFLKAPLFQETLCHRVSRFGYNHWRYG